MMRPSLMAAGLLVFVDSMKELPLTLLLRPFDSETLATWVWHYARDEAFAVSAPGALLIVSVGLLPVIWMSSMIAGRTDGRNSTGWLFGGGGGGARNENRDTLREKAYA